MPTLTSACVSWITSQPHLSPATCTSYRGEVDRLIQFLTSRFALRHTGQLAAPHWQAYLLELHRPRECIGSRRKDLLSSSSIRQADRICRSFLVWCMRQGFTKWCPPRGSSEIQEASPAERETPRLCAELPSSVSEAIRGRSAATSMEDLRAILALNLIYWGALEPAQLVLLKADQWTPMGGLSIERGSAARSVVIPRHVNRIWSQYRKMREDRYERPLNSSSPVLSRLSQDYPVLPWAVWSIVKNWQEKNGVQQPITPRLLRASFIHSVQHAESTEVSALATHIGAVSLKVNRGTSHLLRSTVQTIQARQAKRLQPI